ncbi:MAG: 3-dehydroquinate synthase, partial [Ectothiorhodospiraceae bacterium]|nr:3-dehydroquinate synthase [Ectothiorhodospiraceae bacterium]
MTQTLNVDLGSRSYPIHIGPGLIDQGELIRPLLRGRSALIVTTQTGAPLYLERLQRALGADIRQDTVTLPDGEGHK